MELTGSVVRRLGLAAAVTLMLVGGTLLAQLSDLSHDNPLPGNAIGIGLPTTVLHEDAKLLASDGMAGDSFGRSVAISGDTVIVGANRADGFSGSAYVFVRGGTCGADWCEEAELLPSDPTPFDHFGFSVSVSGDTAVVGALFSDVPGGGAAYVFVRGGTCGEAWCQEAKLLASDAEPFERFGSSVSVSGDTAVVAADLDDNGDFAGSAYVFVRGGTCGEVWCEEAKLLPSDGLLRFATRVAVSGDTAVIGADGDDDNGFDSGSAYVFVRGGTCEEAWCEEAKLLPSDPAFNQLFGYRVAVSDDTAVIGAIGDRDNGPSSGAAYVFVRGGTCGETWCEEAKLLASDGESTDRFGFTVSVSGGTAVIGSQKFDDSGSAYVFVRRGTCGKAWCEEAKLLASDAELDDGFGFVGVGGDTAVVGAILDDDNGDASGSAYMFTVPVGEDDEGGDDEGDDDDEDSDEAGPAGLSIFPASGDLVLTSGFDLTLIADVPAGVTVTGAAATLDGNDFTGNLASCLVSGSLLPQGLTLRCPGLDGATFGPGVHTLDVTLSFSNGSNARDTVTWEVFGNTEP